MDLFTFTAELARNGNVVSIDQGDPFCTGTSSFHCCDHPRCTIQVPHSLIHKRSGLGWKCPLKGCNNEYTFRIAYPSTAPSGAATSPNEELSFLRRRISGFDQSVENRFEHIERMIMAMHESFEDRNDQVPNLNSTTSSTCGSAGGGVSEASIRVVRKKVDELHQLVNDNTRDMSTTLTTAKQLKEAMDSISNDTAATNDQILALIRGFTRMELVLRNVHDIALPNTEDTLRMVEKIWGNGATAAWPVKMGSIIELLQQIQAALPRSNGVSESGTVHIESSRKARSNSSYTASDRLGVVPESERRRSTSRTDH